MGVQVIVVKIIIFVIVYDDVGFIVMIKMNDIFFFDVVYVVCVCLLCYVVFLIYELVKCFVGCNQRL